MRVAFGRVVVMPQRVSLQQRGVLFVRVALGPHRVCPPLAIRVSVMPFVRPVVAYCVFMPCRVCPPLAGGTSEAPLCLCHQRHPQRHLPLPLRGRERQEVDVAPPVSRELGVEAARNLRGSRKGVD